MVLRAIAVWNPVFHQIYYSFEFGNHPQKEDEGFNLIFDEFASFQKYAKCKVMKL